MPLRATDDESKRYWAKLKKNAEAVDAWPEWKKGRRRIRVVAEQEARERKREREEEG